MVMESGLFRNTVAEEIDRVCRLNDLIYLFDMECRADLGEKRKIDREKIKERRH